MIKLEYYIRFLDSNASSTLQIFIIILVIERREYILKQSPEKKTWTWVVIFVSHLSLVVEESRSGLQLSDWWLLSKYFK